MKIELYPALSISKSGKRQYNEDCIYPIDETTHPVEGLFLVCDGVGGSAGGGIASRLTCNLLVKYFTDHVSDTYELPFFEKAVDLVKENFSFYVKQHPEVKEMATTLTLAYFTSAGVHLVHCGDSRIYHIRDGSILYRSKDHSYLNLLLDMGEITPEEIVNNPMRNVITRAISAQPSLLSKIDIFSTPDVKINDYFMLCTDGVLEAVAEDVLINIMADNKDNSGKIGIIECLCDKYSQDNFSCFLIQVKSIKNDKF